MNYTIFLCCFLPLFIVLLQEANQRKTAAILHVIRRKKKGMTIMTELLNNYVGKECVVYTMNGQVVGTIREIREGWLSVDNRKDVELVNMEYVVRVREYPRNRKGKKVAAVLD